MNLFDLVIAFAQANRRKSIVVAACLVAVIALADWKVTPNISLGFLYLFPLLLAAGVLNRWQVVAFAVVCSFLREVFSPWAFDQDVIPRLTLVLIAYTGTGLFVTELNRNRRLAVEHLREVRHEVRLREEAEEHLRVLVETSPLAILVLNGEGRIVTANRSAHRLLDHDKRPLGDEQISRFLPFFENIPHLVRSPQQFRTTVEDRGRRLNGDAFLARIWFSTYSTASGPRLAAIVADISEDLRDREELGLRRVLASSGVVMGAVLHEVRNFCGAISMLTANLSREPQLTENEDLRALASLSQGLEKIASTELRTASDRHPGAVDLGAVLDELRIIIEPSFRESGIELRWDVNGDLPPVEADHHGLLQVFLNLAENSRRALQSVQNRHMTIAAAAASGRITVRFSDTGPGVPVPQRLFTPMQEGAETTGLGLYISRVLIRAFRGELRHEPAESGCCFSVELPVEQGAGETAS